MSMCLQNSPVDRLVALKLKAFIYSSAGTSALETIQGIVTQRILRRLNVTDATHFYNLASLEATLLCLMHVTAR